MQSEERKTSSLNPDEIQDTASCLNEVKKLQSQLEEERKAASRKEQIMSNSLKESKQMATHLQQITQALAKERKLAIEKSEKEQLLWTLIERINSSFDLEHILQATVDELGHYFKVSRCGIIIPNYKANKDLVREFAWGEWKRLYETYSQVTYSVLYKTVTKTLQPLVINDTITHELTSGHLSEDLRSILMVPLLQANNDLVGVVYLHQCRKQRTWTDHELSMLQSASGPIATAVEKTKLFNRAKSWASREKLLNRLTARIRGTLNINVILERTVVELGQALQANRCFIHTIDPRTTREKITHQYSATNIKPLQLNVESPLIINKLIEKKGDIISITDIFKEPRLIKLNNKEIETIYTTEARAFLAVPITFQRKFFGWLCFHQCNVPRNWTSEEISFIQSASSQVGVAINQAEMVQELTEYQNRLSRELKQAAQLQSVLLSTGTDIKKNLPIAVSYHPHHNVSGDFYWIFDLAPHKIGIFIGDVSGKGPAAALLTGFIIGEIKGLLDNQNILWHPEEFLTAIGDSIYEQNQYSDFYATAWYGIFDIIEGTLLCSNAGHPSPYLIRRDVIEQINDSPGVPLGLLSLKDRIEAYKSLEFKLNINDKIIIITDGLIEQRQLDGRFVSESWLKEALSTHDKYKLSDLPEELMRKLNIESKAAPQDDDRLVIAVEMPQIKTLELYEETQEHINEKIETILSEVSQHGLPKDLLKSLKLGLLEAIYNAFRHGLKNTPKDKKPIVTLAWWLKDNSFSCLVKDSGLGFNWQQIINTRKQIKDVDILSEGGRGIPLLFEIFHKVVWNPEGNEIGLTMKW